MISMAAFSTLRREISGVFGRSMGEDLSIGRFSVYSTVSHGGAGCWIVTKNRAALPGISSSVSIASVQRQS